MYSPPKVKVAYSLHLKMSVMLLYIISICCHSILILYLLELELIFLYMLGGLIYNNASFHKFIICFVCKKVFPSQL